MRIPIFSRDQILHGLLFVLPALLMGLLAIHTLSSIYQDIGRHITLGRIIWETKHIPGTNLFSFTHPDFPFTNHHWLSEVFLYWGDRMVGLKGLIVAKAFLLMGAFGLAYAAAWRPKVAVPAAVTAGISLLILLERTDVRPEILSFFFLGWFLCVLYRKPVLVWTLPLVQVLWVNSHIYFFMGPLVWIAWLIGQWIEKGSWRIVYSRRVVVITALLALATILNPHGLSGALYPLRVFGNYGYSVLENKSPAFLSEFGYPPLTTTMLYVGIGITVMGYVLNWRNLRRNVFGLIVCGITAGLALSMLRNFPLLALCMLPATIKNFDERGLEWRWLGTYLVPILALFGVSIMTGQLYMQAHLGRQFGLIVPEGYQRSVDFFRTAGVHGPIFNNFDVGSFLIWKLPEEPVFIDGRPEAYPADFIQKTYIPMQENADIWMRESEHYGINAIFWNTNDITPWSRSFLSRIVTDSTWVPIYYMDAILIMVKNVPENRALIDRYQLQLLVR